MRLLRVGASIIDVDKVVGIERGDWSNDAQDCLAVAVCEGNTRMALGIYCEEFAKMLLSFAG